MNEIKNTQKITNKDTLEEMKILVIERINATSPNLRMHVGIAPNKPSYTREELIANVKAGNEIGMQIINAQIEYLKAMASGEIYKLL